MEWSKKIFSVAGIPVKIHLSVGLLLIWILTSQAGEPVHNTESGHNTHSGLSAVLTFIFVLVSITMHELAHALTARHFNIRTRDIVLYPFGGVAYLLDKITAKQELFITLAGPLSNLLLAAAIFFHSQNPAFNTELFLRSNLGELFAINIILGVFNLIPAFPMDGGRILRASLQLLKINNANLISLRFSQTICIILGLTALHYSHLMLFLIAVFIFTNASKEALLSDAQAPALNLQAKDVMVPLENLQSISPSSSLESAANFALKSVQTHFPIMLGVQFLGLVEREDLLQKAVSNIDSGYVTEIMLKNIPSCSPELSLEATFKILEENFAKVLLVINSELPVGLIFKDQLQSLLLIKQVFKQNSKQRELERDLGAI